MKAKTKRRLRHLVTKKKLVNRKTSRHFLRTAIIVAATISTGSLAYAITLNKPTISVTVNSGVDGKVLKAPVTPTPSLSQVVQSGRGSWYALGLPAPDTLTCASRTFPRGSYLHVTDLYNGHVVICRVNDYGPEAWTGRVIDLSRGSFRQVDDLGRGTIPVEIRLASGSTGLNLPIIPDVSSIVGYSLCNNHHTAQFCETHRQSLN
jgi:rare lipoprotein A (peptidoglycan hydrolase)